MSNKSEPCLVCENTHWLALPPSHPTRSVRSDGMILNRPMAKAQCSACGLVQAMQVPNAAVLNTLYRDEYDIYNKRPASEQFVLGRYTALAQAITASVSPMQPKRVLEVGCGNGSALAAIKKVWKDSICQGLEPVTSAVEMAREHGLDVVQGMIGQEMPEEIASELYDVIYSIHVIEHTEDPVAFLSALKKMLAPNGRLIITCPNARIPNLEIMRTDHNYSMTPYHLSVVARKAGLMPLKSTLCPGGGEGLDYEHNQLLVCSELQKEDGVQVSIALPDYLSKVERQHLYGARCSYFNDFAMLDEQMQSLLGDHKRIYCFGTGGWTCMLAGYAPLLWERIEACVIDGGADGEFYGKSIIDYHALEGREVDGVVVGVNPATQPLIARRLEKDNYNVLRWDNIIQM